MIAMPTESEPVTILEGDCLEWLPRLPTGCVDAVVTDPPYGIGYDTQGSSQQGIKRYHPIHGDSELFDPSHLMGYPDVILWGCNNYCHLIPPLVGQWYFWDKVTRNDLKVRIAESEYAWHKKGTKPRGFRHLWSGAYRASENHTASEHPTQKPVALMRWCIRRLKLPPGSLILDPYCGSGSTLVAAVAEGMRAIGIEREPQYVAIARRRVAEAMGTAPGQLFGAATMPQADLLLGTVR